MKRIIAVAGVVTLFLWLAQAAHAALETFDSGTDGWGISLIDSSGYSWSAAPTFSASGGNPGGCISGIAGSADSRLLSFDAPAYASSNLLGQTFTVDVSMSGPVSTASGQAMARFYLAYDSSDYFITTNAYSLILSGSGAWTTYTVPVTAADFMAWPGQTGTMSFAAVAADPVWVGVLFTSSDFSASNYGTSLLGLTSPGGTSVSIDNFGPVKAQVSSPTPSAVLLLAPGMAALILFRRRWKTFSKKATIV